MPAIKRISGICLGIVLLGPIAAHAENNGGVSGIQCLNLRQDPTSPTSPGFLTLPFYQPHVDSSSIDLVVTDIAFPESNRYTLQDHWSSSPKSPLIPITHWRMSEYTGLATADLAGTQRAHLDSYGKSGEQMIGRWAGFWMNTQNDPTPLANGSLSTNVGCWYQSPPYARLFSNIAQVLDVAFDTGIEHVSASGGAHSQAYFQAIVTDTGGRCDDKCAFSISVGYAGPDMTGAMQEVTIRDDTGTTTLPLVNAGLDAPRWISRMSDSMHFRTGTFAPARVHFRLSPSQLILMRNDVARTFGAYQKLSLNPLDYALTLLNVNGEVYDPCKANAGSCTGTSPSQLGMSVGNIRVTSVIPHQATGTPATLAGEEPLIVFRNDAGELLDFSAELGPEGPMLDRIGTQLTTADPSATHANGVQRVYFLDGNRHIFEAFRTNASWQLWDMSAAFGLADAYSPPRAYTPSDGMTRVYFRDVSGHVHEVRLTSTGWTTRDLTTATQATNLPAALGSPIGYQADGADRVVYRGVGNQLIELFLWNGNWQAWNMTTTPEAVPAAADPTAFVDPEGSARVTYRDINGALHMLSAASTGWHDTDFEHMPGFVPALGSPSGFLMNGSTNLLYQGVDHHLYRVVLVDGQWVSEDMSLVDGAVSLASDPAGYTDAYGTPRIAYVGNDGQLHEFFWQKDWLHRDL
ncbi:hypothetical protein [uncultured Xanthomonas sp.]|uniref:hypothetical protein n=1 Tax=uncultured Xanthomonas sp. TaxID=152831 RepID=UPI0025D0F774|nr:hypothetical protein [uncultured Xanthomonas sp.]